MALTKKPAAAKPAAVARKAAPAPTPVRAASSGFVSFDPDTFTAGGMIDDVDVEITDALAVKWDYNGNAPEGPALALEFTDPNGQTHTQYYSAGKSEDWEPAESGEGFVAVSGKAGFNQSTNLAMFLDSLIKAGFPKDQLDGNVKRFVGLKCHVLQTATERKGLIRTGPNASRPQTVLLVSKINQLPSGETVGAASTTTRAAAGGKANGKAAQEGTAAPSLDETITGILVAALAETPVIDKKEISKLVFAHYRENNLPVQERNKAVIRAGQQDFLASLAESGIAYDGASISAAE